MCILGISFRETYFIVALYTIEMFGSGFKFDSRFGSIIWTHIIILHKNCLLSNRHFLNYF